MILQLQGFYSPHCNVAVVTQARNNTHITEWTDGMKPTASGSAYNVSVQTAMLSLEKHGQHVHKNQHFQTSSFLNAARYKAQKTNDLLRDFMDEGLQIQRGWRLDEAAAI